VLASLGSLWRCASVVRAIRSWADGAHSRVRRLAFGEGDRFVRQLGYRTAAFVFKDDAMQAEIGNAFATLTVPGRQLALYPIRGGKIATFWVHRADGEIPDRSAAAAPSITMRPAPERQFSGESVIPKGGR
jgi:2-polyprenyl-6-methoxyphenol hydroxylase-like FAD-dependent oxidoreductase